MESDEGIARHCVESESVGGKQNEPWPGARSGGRFFTDSTRDCRFCTNCGLRAALEHSRTQTCARTSAALFAIPTSTQTCVHACVALLATKLATTSSQYHR